MPQSIMRPDAFFHTGLVVKNLDEAMATLSAVAGYTWTTVMQLEVSARLPDGVRDPVAQRFVLSVDEPRLELVEEIPGSVWVSDGANGAHHVGYWAEPDRIQETSDALVAQGLPVEASNDHETDGVRLWIYHRGLGGLRIELLSTVMKGPMDAWIAGVDPGA